MCKVVKSELAAKLFGKQIPSKTKSFLDFTRKLKTTFEIVKRKQPNFAPNFLCQKI